MASAVRFFAAGGRSWRLLQRAFGGLQRQDRTEPAWQFADDFSGYRNIERLVTGVAG
ncbi:MAG: hypothetical protein AW08_01024 [Candidatus Accumulibacter adjunctus]|uniref:Uncharacterized protein n=1 Tax=Candidatus Accumulibacter adjunctus TaxID=1454001 RepID=A0A011NVS4_9PROT|nr:MAG: hypothetical protein AW08_01024 [Candidatus Accumulibacter adjunctus]